MDKDVSADKPNPDDKAKKDHSEKDPEVPIPAEILEEIPEEIRPKFKHDISMFMAEFQGRASPQNPIFTKINESHIDKILSGVENSDIRQAEAAKSTRRYVFAGFIFLLLVAVALAIFFEIQRDTAILVNLIIAIFSFAGGFGTGKFFHK